MDPKVFRGLALSDSVSLVLNASSGAQFSVYRGLCAWPEAFFLSRCHHLIRLILLARTTSQRSELAASTFFRSSPYYHWAMPSGTAYWMPCFQILSGGLVIPRLQFLANLGWFGEFGSFLPSSLVFPVYRAGQDSSGVLPIAFRSRHGGHELGAGVAFLVHEVGTSHHVGLR